MSDLHPETMESGIANPSRVDVFALTRALVFTKEAYRTLRSRIQPRARRPIDLNAHISLKVTADPATKALTPWDMIEEEDSSAGVTFTLFQTRPRRADRQNVAA